eukprot:352713-Prymnesium_polylepis.1
MRREGTPSTTHARPRAKCAHRRTNRFGRRTCGVLGGGGVLGTSERAEAVKVKRKDTHAARGLSGEICGLSRIE